MPTYIEYELEDGVTILVQAPEEEQSGVVKSSRDVEVKFVLNTNNKIGVFTIGQKYQSSQAAL